MTEAAKGKQDETEFVYLDNAASTMCPQPVIDTMVEWCNRGNASAEHSLALDSRRMMDSFRRYIADQCGIELEGPKGYTILFTSSGSEANCHIISAAVRAFAHKTGKKPHLIVSAIEHKSVLLCAARLAKEKLTELTIIPVQTTGDAMGTIDPYDVEAALRPNTCLVSVMAANNETGIINDIAMIGVACRGLKGATKGSKIPFHTDAVQLFGKLQFRPASCGVDAFSISFHKIHGPPGVGALVISSALIAGYDLASHICGTQNAGLRGGTENIPGIAASFAAAKLTFADRVSKGERTAKLREATRAALGTKFPTFFLDDYRAGKAAAAVQRAGAGGPAVLVWIAPKDPVRTTPGVLLLAAYRPRVCNRRTRRALEEQGVIVSVGSACNASDHHASSTIAAIDVPEELRSGILRVSLGDDSTAADIKRFVRIFVEVLGSSRCLLENAEDDGDGGDGSIAASEAAPVGVGGHSSKRRGGRRKK